MQQADHGPQRLPAELEFPGGSSCRGELRVRGVAALNFRASGAEAPPPWRGSATGRVTLAGDEGDALQLEVACNGYVSGRLDLSVVGGLDAGAARRLAMTLDGEPWSRERSRGVYDQFLDDALGELGDSFRGFLNGLADFLFDLSTAPRQGVTDRQSFYDALNVLKRNSEPLCGHFVDALRRELRDPAKGQARESATLEDADASRLDLIALSEMDERVELERIVSDSVDRFHIDLESLTLRVGDLMALGAARTKTPFHPAYLCRAFDEALHAIEFPAPALPNSLRYFHREWIRKLLAFYAQANDRLAAVGLRPGQEDELHAAGSIVDGNRARQRREARSRRGGAADRAVEERRDDGAERQPPAAPEPDSPAAPPTTPAAPRQKHDAIYDAVVHALSLRNPPAVEREDDDGPDDAGTAPARVDAAAVADLLRQVETAPATDPALARLPLRELLAQQGEAGQAAARQGSETGNRLDFVDDIFRTIQTNDDVSDQVKPSLDRLRLPLARLALREPHFFAEPAHPAHQFLERLSRLAGTANFPNRVLERKIDDIVTGVAASYGDDSAAFGDALSRLQRLVEQNERSLRRNIERVVSGLEGEEQLRRARARVTALVDRLVAPPAAPRILLELLDAGWRDMLTRIAVRHDADAPEWQRHEEALHVVVGALSAAGEGRTSPQLPDEVRDAVRLLRRELQTTQPENMACEDLLQELSAILRGDQPLETVAVTPAETSPTAGPVLDEARLAGRPRLQRWLQRVSELRTGTVMSYRNRAGARRRIRLVWISEERNRFVFVNELGQKAADLSRIELARKLSQGLAPPARLDDMSLLDQGIYGTLSATQERLGFKRTHDSQTRMYNADYFHKYLQRTVLHAQQRDAGHALLCVDIDSFHLVNELYDEDQGDNVIAEFARLLSQLNARRALSARLEGDRFGIILAHRDRDAALAFAERLRQDIAESSLTIGGEEVTFTVSVGLVPIVQATAGADEALAQAREALALAKERGRNRCEFYDLDEQQLAAHYRERDRSRTFLDEAIATDQLVLRAQPIVQSAIGSNEPPSHHYEVLLALRQADGELHSPASFLASAERFGFVTRVDRWVVRRVCEWISSLMDNQKVVPRIALNLAGTSLTDDAFLDFLLKQISEFGVGTSKLCFEITETGAIDNLTKAADFIRTLQNIGCSFSLDDFGTGMAGFSYLRELPVDNVKIDGTFIRNVPQRGNDFAMVRSINDLAHFLGQKTIAECVESLAAVEPLHEIGIDYLQGWGIGVPRPLEEITRELDSLET